MSDVEIGSATQSSEGSTNSAEAGSAVGTGGGEPQQVVEAAPQGIAGKIAKHKTPGSTIDSGAQVGVHGAAQIAAAKAAQGVNLPGAVTPGVAAYQANHKFMFRGREQEIPEMYRGLMKDAASEKQIRELHEQAMWFQETKPRFQEQGQQLTGITKGLEVLDKHLADKDYGKFFSAFGLTDEQIFDYAKSRLDYHQLPQDQKQRMDAENELRERSGSLEQQNASLQERQDQYETQQKDTQLRGILNHPSISPVAERHPGGQSGFYRDVAQHAWFHQQNSGEDMSPEQAVLSYIQQRGLSASPPANATQQVAQMQPHQQVQQQPQRAPTLPTFPSQGTSPAKTVVSSMKDLRAAKARAEAQHNG